MTIKSSRRALAKQIASIVGGISIFGPALAQKLLSTPAQVEGPFYPPGQLAETDVDLTMLEGHTESATGDVILVRGRVTDTDGNPLSGAQVDIWQANHVGRYSHPEDPNPAPLDPNFQGIGITHTDAEGMYGFKTIIPAAYPLKFLAEGNDGWRARHIHFKVAHENASSLTTQMYFEGDPLLEQDGGYNEAPEDQRHLLVTSPKPDEETGLPIHRFDIALA
ncbi:MAG: protocatechuate 3,4-dioxygenase beta subunit [Lysobacterales bacterium]|jgi:protocatechuate 3,4-dioxygenase beta subunit